MSWHRGLQYMSGSPVQRLVGQYAEPSSSGTGWPARPLISNTHGILSGTLHFEMKNCFRLMIKRISISLFLSGALCAGQSVLTTPSVGAPSDRSEERRVGKECRSRWSPYH